MDARFSARLICLFCLCVLLSSLCHAETLEKKVLTLSAAIETALKNHPAIEEKTGLVSMAEARTGQAKGGLYPQVNIGSGVSEIWPVSSETTSSTSNAGLPDGSYIPASTSENQGPYRQYAATGNLTQLLMDFGKSFAQIRAHKLNTEATRYELQNARDQVVFNVKQAYFTLLSAQRTRDVVLESVAQFARHLEYARARYQIGAKPRFDVTKAEVDLSNAKVDLIKAENAVRLGMIVLNNAMGLPGTGTCAVEDDLSPELSDTAFPDAEHRALASRPDLLSIQKQKSSAMESIRAAKMGHLPVINGTANITYVGTEFPLDHGWTAGVNMVIPLFSGFATSYRVDEARANLRVAAANERNLKQTILLELEQGFLSLKEAEARIMSSETAIKQARENLDLANERYKTGLGIAVEVSDAILSYANAQMSGITARYDYKIAQAMIDKAMGGASR